MVLEERRGKAKLIYTAVKSANHRNNHHPGWNNWLTPLTTSQYIRVWTQSPISFDMSLANCCKVLKNLLSLFSCLAGSASLIESSPPGETPMPSSPFLESSMSSLLGEATPRPPSSDSAAWESNFWGEARLSSMFECLMRLPSWMVDESDVSFLMAAEMDLKSGESFWDPAASVTKLSWVIKSRYELSTTVVQKLFCPYQQWLLSFLWLLLTIIISNSWHRGHFFL